MMKKLNKNSSETLEYPSIFKKLTKNEEEIFKKCSLKNLQVYEDEKMQNLLKRQSGLVGAKIKEREVS